MTKKNQENMKRTSKMNRKEIIDKIDDITWEMNNLLNGLEKDDVELDEPATSLNEWKSNVIKNLPKGSSLAFELKVQEFLDSITGVE